jgi:hypothetical protein
VNFSSEAPIMTTEPATCPSHDLIAARWACFLWCAAGIAFLAGCVAADWRALLWISSLSAAGLLCVLNASRCHRTHCYITGPVFLLGALLTAVRAANVFFIPWNWIAYEVFLGSLAAWLLEVARGRYAS